LNDGLVKYKHVQDDTYLAKLMEMEAFWRQILRFLPRGVPDFPSHGVDHSEKIVILINDFIEEWKPELSVKEIYLLYLAAWAHDIGCLNGREKHHIKSVELLKKTPVFESLLGDEIFTDLKWIVVSHSSKYLMVKVPKTCFGVRLKLVASIFRILDGCEMGSSKCPPIVYNLIDDLHPESKKHWEAHLSIIGIKLSYPKIEIYTKNIGKCEILTSHLDEEIYSVKHILDEYDIKIPKVDVKDFSIRELSE